MGPVPRVFTGLAPRGWPIKGFRVSRQNSMFLATRQIATSNPSLCLNNLKSSKDKTLSPNSVAVLLGNSSMDMALSRANRTLVLIWAQYRAISVHKPEMRIMYYNCYLKYTDVMKQLRQAKRFMLAGIARSVKNYVSVAVHQVNSCNEELMKPPREQSVQVLEANDKLKDLCNNILAICNKLEIEVMN
ncbi:hypothetical protein BUALT_Bualt10G0126400 [Buddleja alternifolia]|uniref:Pectinesterase inhibitor domain-containing protein n=1 Tax=Buddleja alternifolia TaxID=168488 RepID=A0AAV6WZD9_9LAMI|nr:hypothetical protein BUALT_Bualt10G0126400 [Buddleja alternifolia]